MCYELDVTKQSLTHILLDAITPAPLILCEGYMLPRLQVVVIVVVVLLIHHPGSSWGHDDDKGP